MNKITVKYKNDKELNNIISGLKQFATVVKISQPKSGDSWKKVYVDIDIKH